MLLQNLIRKIDIEVSISLSLELDQAFQDSNIHASIKSAILEKFRHANIEINTYSNTITQLLLLNKSNR